MSGAAEQSDQIMPSGAPPILPSTGWSASLTTLIAAAMAFIGALVLSAGLAAEKLAAEWRSDFAGVATVRISAAAAKRTETIAAVLAILRTTPGIASARPLTDAEQAALLAPYLGKGVTMGDLPVPRLIAIEFAGSGPDARSLQKRIDHAVSGVLYDDHAGWRRPLASAAAALEALALGAVALLLVTAAAMIAFAARATLAANRDVIQTVRLMGAEDPFLARLFVRRLTRRAAIGGLAGAMVAAAILWLLPAVAVDATFGAGIALRPADWALLVFGVPAAGTLVAWITARMTVQAALRRMP